MAVPDYHDRMSAIRTPGWKTGRGRNAHFRRDVLGYLAGGMTEPEILADFPQLSHDDILACLAFAADRERRLGTVPGL
jgi:hypothetical protein